MLSTGAAWWHPRVSQGAPQAPRVVGMKFGGMVGSWSHQLQEELPRSELRHVGIPQEEGKMWKPMDSRLTQEDFLLEEEVVDSSGRGGQD